ESIHACFLHHAITESGMDVGIVNAKEMYHINDLEPDMLEICENLVFNKIPEATDDMLERTNYERACIVARKEKKAPPRKPRGRPVIVPRMKFDYDNIVPKPAFEPPKPTSDAAQNYVPNPYQNTKLTHEKILEVRSRSTIKDPNATIDWNQDPSLYPADYPHFVRGRDSV
ncbi:hypothetical protein TrST_g819, partial [Triparma strigata]